MVTDLAVGFTAPAFAAASAPAPGLRHYTSLVPTQLVRLLEDPVGTAALRRFDAVLVGGAATPPALRRGPRRPGYAWSPPTG